MRKIEMRWCGVHHEFKIPDGAAEYQHGNPVHYALRSLRFNANKGGEIFYLTADKFLVLFQYGERWYKYTVKNGRVYAHGRTRKIGSTDKGDIK